MEIFTPRITTFFESFYVPAIRLQVTVLREWNRYGFHALFPLPIHYSLSSCCSTVFSAARPFSLHDITKYQKVQYVPSLFIYFLFIFLYVKMYFRIDLMGKLCGHGGSHRLSDNIQSSRGFSRNRTIYAIHEKRRIPHCLRYPLFLSCLSITAISISLSDTVSILAVEQII